MHDTLINDEPVKKINSNILNLKVIFWVQKTPKWWFFSANFAAPNNYKNNKIPNNAKELWLEEHVIIINFFSTCGGNLFIVNHCYACILKTSAWVRWRPNKQLPRSPSPILLSFWLQGLI